MDAKKIVFILLGLNSLHSTSQTIIDDRAGFARAQANIALGFLPVQKEVAAYIASDADVFIKNNISVAGAFWYFIPVNHKPVGLKANHSLTWGFNYHFIKHGRADPYVGLTPGFSIVRVAYNGVDGSIKETPYGVAPVLCVDAGLNYYVGSIFNFFVKVQGVAGQFFGDAPQATPLYELKLTAGLGWNARLWKPRGLQNHSPILMDI